ncbi:MAG: signal peptidase I [Marmoricola sp.]
MTPTMVPARADGDLRRHGSVGLLAAVTRAAGQVLAWVVILGVVAVLAVAVLVPRIGGATPYTILTGSMRPHLPPGTLVVSRPVRTADIGVGTVITYQRESGRPDVVTHRVVEVGQDELGRPRWRTRGDANPVPDADWVRPVQVKGALWYSVPQLGRVNLLLTGHQRRNATVAVALALFGYAVALWLSAVRDRFRRQQTMVTA